MPAEKPVATVAPPRAVMAAVVVAALGYFVDIYDLILFGFIRQESLADIGLTGAAIQTEGEWLISIQMLGLALGGIIWGVLGDRKGRLSVLFGSILMYSLANIANGFVTDLYTYYILRFIAGIGLAGELGAGITLVSELVSKEKRGVATAIVAGFGLLGAVLGGAITMVDWGSSVANWRIAFFIGGGMGLMLLLLRIGVTESGMFNHLKQGHVAGVARGNFFALFSHRGRLLRYLQVILIGVPVWYVVGLFVFFLPEFLKAMNLPQELITYPNLTKYAIAFCYAGIALGDIASGLLSQWMRSRRGALLVFMSASVLVVAYYLMGMFTSVTEIFTVCFFFGFATGYWAVFVTVASEQFGTNLRATVTTTVPNFVRGSLPVITIPLFKLLREDSGLGLGMIPAAVWVGVLLFAVAFWAMWKMPETFGKDLDYLEQ